MSAANVTRTEWRWVLLASLAVLLIASPSIVLLVFGSLGPIRERERFVYHPAAEIAALDWLNGEEIQP